MMLGHPERIVAALVHALGIVDHLVQRLGQFLLRIAALVDRRAGIAEVLHVGGAVIGAVEFRDHRWGSSRNPDPDYHPRRRFCLAQISQAAMTADALALKLGSTQRHWPNY